jgi:hypothetical protein
MAKKKQLGAPTSEPSQTVETVQKYVTLLKDYQNAVFAVVVLVLTVGVLGVWQHQRSLDREEAAWLDLGKDRDQTIDKLQPLLTKYEGTQAHLFLSLAYASKLYERGKKEDLELAKTVLERTKDEALGNEIVTKLLHDQLVGIEKELGDQSLWQKKEKSAGTPEKSDGIGPTRS